VRLEALYEIVDKEQTNKSYALKQLNINLISKQRFERETQILSELNHSNIIKTFQ
jgi:serine/threonine protein kinase